MHAQWVPGCEAARCHSRVPTLKMPASWNPGRPVKRAVGDTPWDQGTGKWLFFKSQQLQFLQLLTFIFLQGEWNSTLKRNRNSSSLTFRLH
ncbi:unnamed protein product, partial [Staurois parvus]